MFQLKTTDAFFPTEPERLMGCLNKGSELGIQLKLMHRFDEDDLQ